MAGTRLIEGRDLARMVALHRKELGDRDGGRRVRAHLREALDQGDVRPGDFSVRDLFEAFVPGGADVIRSWQSGKGGYGAELLEAGEGTAVGYSDFSNITGQIFFTEVKEKYDGEEFVFSKAIESKASTIQDIEKIPGISRVGPQFLKVPEGKNFPRLGVSEDYIEVGYKQKEGAVIEVTKEIVAGDKTGVLLDRCGELGYWLGYDVESRVIDAVLDQNAGAASAYNGGHRFTWKGTAYASYQTSTPWINSKTSNALGDETNIDALWQLLAQILDPYTQTPILIQPDTLIVAPDLMWKAHRLIRSTEIRQTAPGYATSGSPIQQVSTPALNAVIPNLKVLSSRILRARMSNASEATTDWFLGNPRKYARRYYNWDITTAQRSTGTEAEFERDVVLQFKASLKDVVSVIEPRVMGKSAA